MSNFSFVWSAQASKQLSGIYNFIAKESPQAASKIIFILLNHVEFLSSFPKAGKTDEALALLKLHHLFTIKGNYKIIYRIIEKENLILINAVFDTRQNPKKLKDHIK